jgi:hypothetical protein
MIAFGSICLKAILIITKAVITSMSFGRKTSALVIISIALVIISIKAIL